MNTYATNLFGKTSRRTSEMTAFVRYGHLRRWPEIDTSHTVGAYDDTPQQLSQAVPSRLRGSSSSFGDLKVCVQAFLCVCASVSGEKVD